MGLLDVLTRLQKNLPGNPGFPAPMQAGSALMPGDTPDPAQMGQPSGLMGFMRQAQQPGGFVERLGDFGASLQDIDDGGNRSAGRAQARQQTAAEQAAAQQREQINMLAKSLNLSPQDQLYFNANPEGFLTAYEARQRAAAEREAEASKEGYLNTARGIYRTGPNAGWAEQFEPEVDSPGDGLRWTADGGVEPIPGWLEYQSRLAAARRAPPRPRAAPRPRSNSGSAAAPVNPSDIRWD